MRVHEGGLFWELSFCVEASTIEYLLIFVGEMPSGIFKCK